MNGLVVLVGAAIVAAPVPVVATAGALPIKTARLEGHGKHLKYDIAYPETGNPKIDGEIAGWARKKVADFQAQVRNTEETDEPPPPDPYEISISYEVPRNDAKLFEVTFSGSYSGWGVHENHTSVSFNYLMPDGWRVFLPEIFSGEALKRISTMAVADLRRQLRPSDREAAALIARGARPQWRAFEDFTLLPRTLVVRFPEDAVADIASGPQEVKLPLAKLAGAERVDWRAPVASFDCAAAKTPIERAICSDVELARLDRRARDAYLRALEFAENDSKHDEVRATQRAWLAGRDAECARQTAPSTVACLSSLYRARLKILELNEL